MYRIAWSIYAWLSTGLLRNLPWNTADMPVSDVEMLGISRVKIVNRPNETVPAVFNQQVSVVVHQAPCKQRDIVLFDSLP